MAARVVWVRERKGWKQGWGMLLSVGEYVERTLSFLVLRFAFARPTDAGFWLEGLLPGSGTARAMRSSRCCGRSSTLCPVLACVMSCSCTDCHHASAWLCTAKRCKGRTLLCLGSFEIDCMFVQCRHTP